MIKNYNIFGKHVQINLHDEKNNTQKDIILNHFSLYEEIVEDGKPYLVIDILTSDSNENVKAINPKIHIEVENGFKTIAPKIIVEYKKDHPLSASVILENQKKGIIKYLKKLYNNQYSSIDERLSQVLYELVLVPTVYFNPEQFIVHSSAFKKENEGAILIGGTGGVGKTSLEIELCMNRGYSFMADDISVVNKEAQVWPNLSFPKIYAYNLQDNQVLKGKIFKSRPLHDKLAWRFKHLLNGPAGVRRTISPKEVYGKYEKKEAKIGKYYILMKKQVDAIKVETISAKLAAEMTVKIMQTEYAAFNNHILWHEFNSLSLNTEPILKADEIFKRWLEIGEQVFEKIDCYMVNIPLKIDHKDFTTKVADIIEAK